MATEILKIGDDDDDEISILYSTPPSFKSGATKSDAISVETYRRTSKIPIDLSQFDNVVEVPASSFTKRKSRFYRGESSNSKRNDNDGVVSRLSFTCEICADEKPISDSFRILGCDHRYCTQCVTKYVAARLQESITAIGCPVPGCAGFLEPQHCRTILPREVFDRWGDALCESLILGAERFYCPYKECSALLIDDGREKVVQSECPECRRLFCVPCKAAWHVGIDCAEFQRLKADETSNEDLKLMKLAKTRKWVRCPSCRIYVSRSRGCSSMRCRCGCRFCYKCGAERCKCMSLNRWRSVEAMSNDFAINDFTIGTIGALTRALAHHREMSNDFTTDDFTIGTIDALRRALAHHQAHLGGL